VRFVRVEGARVAVVPGEGDAEPGCEGGSLGAAWMNGSVSGLYRCGLDLRAVVTYGLRGCCRRRRLRGSMLLLLLKGPGSGCEGLRLRIGCARRRRSRRGVGGWPCLLLVVSVSRRRLLRAVFWLMEFAFKRLLDIKFGVAYFAGVWACKAPVVNEGEEAD
jgi:hypothetical protein